jgi:hypothetical protein
MFKVFRFLKAEHFGRPGTACRNRQIMLNDIFKPVFQVDFKNDLKVRNTLFS